MQPESPAPSHGRHSARPHDAAPVAQPEVRLAEPKGHIAQPVAQPDPGPAQPDAAAQPHRAGNQRPTRRSRPIKRPHQTTHRHPATFQYAVAVGAVALALVAGMSIAPTQHVLAEPASVPVHMASQVLDVDSSVAAPTLTRAEYSATDGVQTFASSGTNADWAKLVLLDGGWPQTEANVDFMLRWMRQENGPPDWWNRNNPLNNGYGSGGGAGLGSYDNLEEAAMYIALNLQRGYPDVVAGLTAGTSADVTAQAIWASPWATSHYGNGSHWSTAPVEIVQAPASAW